MKSDEQRLYSIYHNIKRRCYYKKSNRYKNYGAKGIKMCDEWFNDIKSFKKWAYENGYQSNLTIDRIDNNGDYKPSNCRWVTYKEQNRNYSKNVVFEYNGDKKPLVDWAEQFKVKYATLYKRLVIKKWNIKEALNKPVKRKEK